MQVYVNWKENAGAKSHINQLCEIMRKIYLIKMFVKQINYYEIKIPKKKYG